jgi:hypothetical protein
MAASPTERGWCVQEFARCNSFVSSSFGVPSRTMFTSHHFQKHYQNCENASTPQSGTSHSTCLRGFGGNGSIAWTFAVSHVGRTSNPFKVAMKLQTFLFQMVVTSCISVQYLCKYGFAKYSYNLYAPCIYGYNKLHFRYGRERRYRFLKPRGWFADPRFKISDLVSTPLCGWHVNRLRRF